VRHVLLGGKKVGQEIDVARVWNALESLHAVQGDVLIDELAVGDGSRGHLRFAPAIEAIPDARLLSNLRTLASGLAPDEVLGLSVARVVADRQVEGETAVEVFETLPERF